MKNVLLSEIGHNIYIIEGSRRTDNAARAAISALFARGIISKDLAERAKGDRATLDKIKRNMESVMLEITGDKWNFYTKSGLYMSIPANCEKYILVDSTEQKRKPAAEEAPTGEETPEPAQTTTTPEKEPENGTETETKTIRTGERLYSHPHRHMVTVEGLQGDLVRVIYKGRLYLVCISDLYTDETETTPAMLQPQAAESAEKTADDTTPTAGDTEPQRATETAQKAAGDTAPIEGTQEGAQTAGTSEGAHTTTTPHTEPPRAADAAAGSVSQSDRTTRPAAPQSHGTTKGIQRHHRPPKTAYRAIQRAATIPARYHHAQTTTSRGSPKICIFWGDCEYGQNMNDQITPHPIFEPNFQSFDTLFAGSKIEVRGTGDQNLLQPRRKNFFKKKKGEYHNGEIYMQST